MDYYFEGYVDDDLVAVSDIPNEIFSVMIPYIKQHKDLPLSKFEVKYVTEEDFVGRVVWRADWYYDEKSS